MAKSKRKFGSEYVDDTPAEILREQSKLRAENASYASQLSDTESKILSTLENQKLEDMEKLAIGIKHQGMQQKILQLIGDQKDSTRELAEEMAEYTGSVRKTVPYQKEIASMESLMLDIRTKRSGLNAIEQMYAKKYIPALIEQLKNLQEQKMQLEMMKERHADIEKILDLQEGTIASIGAKMKAMLLNPWMAVVALLALAVKKYVDMQNAGEEFRKTTGLTTAQTKEIEQSSREVARDLGRWGVNFEEALKGAEALFKTMGNTSLMTKDNIKLVSELSKNLGVSEETGAAFVKNMSLVGGNARALSDSLKTMAAESGVSMAEVMSDMAEASGDAYAYMSKAPKEFMRTAVEARKLGLSMKQVSDITSGLLDIEDSLNAEMEASILSGKRINLDAARYYALIGDQGKAMEEVMKQTTSLAEFNKMGPIAQQAMAKALNMSVEDLAKAVKLREQEKKLTFAQKQEAKERAAQEQRIQGNLKDMQNAWSRIISDVSSIFLPVVERVGGWISKISQWLMDIRDAFMKITGASSETADTFREIATWAGIITIAAAKWNFLGLGSLGKKGLGALGGLFKRKGGGDELEGFRKSTKQTVFGGETGGSKTMESMKNFFKGGPSAGQMLASAVAMLAFAGAVWIIADALARLQNKVDWEAVGAIGLIMLGLTGALLAIGTIAAAAWPVLLAGAAVLLAFGAAVWLVADAAEKMANSSKGLGDLFNSLMTLDVAKLIGVGAGFAAVGYGLGAMAVGAGALALVGTIFGGGKKEGGPIASKDELMLEKLDNVIGLLDLIYTKGLVVNLDGKKMNSTLATRASYGGNG